MLTNEQLERIAEILSGDIEALERDLWEESEGTPESGPMSPRKESIAEYEEYKALRDAILNERTWFVTRYATTREYGGPEEGGWWYDWHQSPTLVATCTNDEEALAICRALNEAEKQIRKDERRPQGRFSVHGGEDMTYHIEKVFGEDTSTEVPHYC